MLSCVSIQSLSTTRYSLISRKISHLCLPVTQVYGLEARTELLAAQRADGTISFFADLQRRCARLEPADIELNPQLKPFADVWPQLVLDDEFVKRCNKREFTTRLLVPALLQIDMFCSLHKHSHHSYEATHRQILQRFWLPRLRADVSALVKACKACDSDRVANSSPRAPLGHLPANQPFAALYFDNVNGWVSL